MSYIFKALKQKKQTSVQEFAHKHKNLLIIVADPKDDSLFMSYGDQQVLTNIKSADGKDRKVVAGTLKHSTFKTNIDRFLAALVDATKLDVFDGNQFYQWIDGALFNISKALKLKKEKKHAKS